jgi:hypothetical protein
MRNHGERRVTHIPRLDSRKISCATHELKEEDSRRDDETKRVLPKQEEREHERKVLE